MNACASLRGGWSRGIPDCASPARDPAGSPSANGSRFAPIPFSVPPAPYNPTVLKKVFCTHLAHRKVTISATQVLMGHESDRRIYGLQFRTHARLRPIRCFRRPCPEFGTPVHDVLATLTPPYRVVKSDSTFRILDLSAAGQGRANRPPLESQTGISRMTAITDILFSQTGQRNGLPVCIPHPPSRRAMPICCRSRLPHEPWWGSPLQEAYPLACLEGGGCGALRRLLRPRQREQQQAR